MYQIDITLDLSGNPVFNPVVPTVLKRQCCHLHYSIKNCNVKSEKICSLKKIELEKNSHFTKQYSSGKNIKRLYFQNALQSEKTDKKGKRFSKRRSRICILKSSEGDVLEKRQSQQDIFWSCKNFPGHRQKKGVKVKAVRPLLNCEIYHCHKISDIYHSIVQKCYLKSCFIAGPIHDVGFCFEYFCAKKCIALLYHFISQT